MRRFPALILVAAFGAIAALPSFAASTLAEQYGWSAPRKPFRIYANTWYVGSKGLSAILITSAQGDILIDGTLTGNEKLIEAHIRALGFRPADVKLILNSHAHADHAGAIATLQRDTGATVIASANGAKALEAGGNDPNDPQFSAGSSFPAIAHVRVARDGETIRLGSLAVQAHATPGHTFGSMSYTWTSCAGARCKDMAYVDSLNLFSREGYRYNDPAHPERLAAFRRTLITVAGLPCDYLMVPHPNVIDFLKRSAERKQGKTDPLDNPHACVAYAAEGQKNLQQRIAGEAAQQQKPVTH